MRESVQISLFFEKDSFYNPTIIASKISERLEYIGSPIILPIDTGAPIDVPFLIFNQNSKFNIISNFYNVSITLFDDLIEKLDDVVSVIFDAFCENNIVRIGYVVSNVLNEDSYEIIKKESGCTDEILKSNDFKIAWLKNIVINGLEINLWKNYFTDKANTSNVLRILDFNTKMSDTLKINKKFALEFINSCKDIIN